MAKSGGQLNPSSGRVEKGRLPKGSLEDPYTFKDGPMRIFRKKGR